MELNEIVKIITDINDELLIYDFATTTITTDGSIIWVEFMNQYIWDSDNDPREYLKPIVNCMVEDDNEKEPLDIFIRKEINKFLDSIRNARLDSSRERYELGPIPEYCKDYMMEKIPDD